MIDSERGQTQPAEGQSKRAYERAKQRAFALYRLSHPGSTFADFERIWSTESEMAPQQDPPIELRSLPNRLN